MPARGRSPPPTAVQPRLPRIPRDQVPSLCAPADKASRPPPAYDTHAAVRDPQIPIVARDQAAPLPPRGFLLGRLSNAGPGTRTTVRQGAGVRNPSP